MNPLCSDFDVHFVSPMLRPASWIGMQSEADEDAVINMATSRAIISKWKLIFEVALRGFARLDSRGPLSPHLICWCWNGRSACARFYESLSGRVSDQAQKIFCRLPRWNSKRPWLTDR